jgi:hypothetical protein
LGHGFDYDNLFIVNALNFKSKNKNKNNNFDDGEPSKIKLVCVPMTIEGQIHSIPYTDWVKLDFAKDVTPKKFEPRT